MPTGCSWWKRGSRAWGLRRDQGEGGERRKELPWGGELWVTGYKGWFVGVRAVQVEHGRWYLGVTDREVGNLAQRVDNALEPG